jgi:uncharacterized metal-binding protein YceD (DUF177 family)
MTSVPPFSYPIDLASLSERGQEDAFEIPEAACQAIAESYKVDGVEDLKAKFHLTRLSKNEYALEGHFSVTVHQTCIVTLKRVQTRLDQDFERHYVVTPLRRVRREATTIDVQLGIDEVERLSGSSLDLAVPVFEEFALMIDPYPRIQGAAFDGGEEAESAKESPFAVLQTLKDRLEPPEKT